MENSSERKGKPRVRSDAQLARKRSVDRLHHQAKRVKEKNQLDIIEDGTAQIQESLRKLMEEVRQLNYALQGPGASPDTFSTPLQPAPLSGTDAIGSTTELERRGSPLTESAQIRDVAHRFLNTRSLPSLHPSIADNVYAAQEPGADWAPADYIAVACRCDNPPSHETESQCFELATYTFLLRAHKSLSKGEKSLRDLPLTPSIANMLLLQNENPIAITLNSAFRHNPSMLNLPSTVAAYFLMFLLLRVSWIFYLISMRSSRIGNSGEHIRTQKQMRIFHCGCTPQPFKLQYHIRSVSIIYRGPHCAIT